jgi:adenine phosphoribosyltransferase
VVLADDLLATGGTAGAVLDLITRSGGKLLGAVFLIELEFLEGRKKIEHYGPIHSLINY